MTSETPGRKLVVPAARFTKAILSDLSRQHDREAMDRELSENGSPYDDVDDGRSSSLWTSVSEAVSTCTRDLRNAGLYPETVLAAIKSAVRQAAASLVSLLAAENMTRDAAQACIAAYFDLSLSNLNAALPRSPVSIPPGTSTPSSISDSRGRMSAPRETIGWEFLLPERCVPTR